MNKRVLIALLIGFLGYTKLFSYTDEVIIKVIDSETKSQLFNYTLTDNSNKKISYQEKNGILYIKIDTLQNNILTFSQQGYESQSILIKEIPKDTLIVKLDPKVINLPTILVSSEKLNKFDEIKSEAYTIKPSEYQKSLGNSLAVSLKNQVGISLSSMGPATARPVFRGLGGNRIGFLTNGVSVSDLSSTSPDHALTINPLAIQKVELIRGPKLLLYSTNSFGAVVNAQNDFYKIPEKFLITPNFLLESANQGISANLSSNIPISNFALGGNVTFQKSNDMKSGSEVIKNSSSKMTDFNFIGLTKYENLLSNIHYENYINTYGVPGGFIGAHPNGINIDIQKNVITLKSIIHFHKPFLDNISLLINRNYYHHTEYEASNSVGSEFVFRDYNFKIDFNHNENEIFDNGTYCIGFVHKDFRGGGYVFTPHTKMNQINATFYEEIDYQNFGLQFSIRSDYASYEPEIRETMNNPPMNREFNSLSWSVAFLKEFNESFSLGFNISKASRIPSIEELYSDGPHLAAYSYEIGNSQLNAESGYGLELFGYYQNQLITMNFSGYLYYYDNYIIPRNTGRLNPQQILPIYQTYGVNSLITGFEIQLEKKLFKYFFIKSNLYVTIGQLLKSKTYLPAIPPIKSNFELRYRNNNFSVGGLIELADSQERTDEFEEITDGYVLFNLYTSKSLFVHKSILSINLSVDNLFNATYRNHLSRIKSIYPESGRSFKLFLKFLL